MKIVDLQSSSSQDLNAHVIALCGRDDMPARLRRASVLVARPSASLFLESILAGVPLLIPAKATKNDSAPSI